MAQELTRRAVLQTSIGGFFGFALARQGEVFGLPDPTLKRKAKSVIVLWMQGGPSQLDTWDPKEGTKNGGPTKAINTAVKSIQYSEHLNVCATQARHITTVRSMTSKEGSHERGRYLLHTGYVPTGTVSHPSMGSITAMELGAPNHDLPNFISIGSPSQGAGFLPPQYNPLVISTGGNQRGGNQRGRQASAAKSPIQNLKYPKGVDQQRFRQRMKLLEMQEKQFAKEHVTDEVDKHKTAYEKANRLMHTPLLSAFDLSKEKPALVKAYGDNPFGKGCLMARKLVEAGVSFVEVNLGNWDTHEDAFERIPQLCRTFDPGMGTLISDLHNRRMLDDTLVIWMGEFGRTPRINGRGGRDHFPKTWSLAMAGGGIPGGRVIGSSGPEGMESVDTPITVPDLFATIYKTIGVDHTKKKVSPLGRPLQFSDSGTPSKAILGG